MIQITQDNETLFSVDKTIRLENQLNPGMSDTIKVRFQYKPTHRKLCFDKVLHYLCKQGYQLEGTQIFFWDNVRNIFVFIGCFPTETALEFPYEFFQQSLIHLRYRRINKRFEAENIPERQIASKRVKERSIQDAYQKVMAWTRIYQQRDQNGKKLYTLQAAARQIGVAKKTLDDYKTQIKLGRKFNFDFDKYRYQKIGVLRNFIKQQSTNQRQSTPPKRPISPLAQPQPLMQIQTQPSTAGQIQQDFGGYLFHQNHSCESD